jgi:phospholipase C
MPARRRSRTRTRTPTRGSSVRKRLPLPARRGALADPIRHVVVLMLENRAFDQMLGGLQPELAQQGLRIDGIDASAPPRENFIQAGPPFQQLPLERAHIQAALTMPDPMHELTNVRLQLGADNSYFALDYVIRYPHSSQVERELVMRYFRPGMLGALHELARHFTVCDRWFASVPGPTWTNRFFVHSGTSIGRVLMPQGVFEPNLHLYDQDTIYDRLNERRRSWRVYYGDVPHSMLLVHQWQPKNAANYRSFDRFARDARAAADDFPDYVFVEPQYMGDDPNDDHPPHDVMRGQRLIADVYNALRSNQALFDSTLLVVLYDEHGGFYDHVIPPAAEPPDALDYEYDFRRLGVRVPVLLVSPWVEHAAVHTTFDHTSVLRYLIEKWGLGPLGNRTASANSIAAAIRTSGLPRTDTPESISPTPTTRDRGVTPRAARVPRRPGPMNDHQRAMQLFSAYLEATQKRGKKAVTVRAAPRARALAPASATQAKARFERFLRSRVQRR